jgi:hypothetical protein
VLSAKASTGESKYDPDDVFLISVDAEAFSLLMEWLYTGSIGPPTSTASYNSKCHSIGSHISLYTLATEYKVKDLADAAMDYIGICYTLTDCLPSKAEMHQALDKSPIGSGLGQYMTNSFLYILSTPSDSIKDGAVPSTTDLWLLAKTHNNLGEYVFECLRDKDPNPPHPNLTSYATIIVMTKILHAQPKGNALSTILNRIDRTLSVQTSNLASSAPLISLIKPLDPIERRNPNEQSRTRFVNNPPRQSSPAGTNGLNGTVATHA